MTLVCYCLANVSYWQVMDRQTEMPPPINSGGVLISENKAKNLDYVTRGAGTPTPRPPREVNRNLLNKETELFVFEDGRTRILVCWIPIRISTEFK